MRAVNVVLYNQQWIEFFQGAETELRTVFGKNLLPLHHIESTAIQGMMAKPVIDIMPVVKNMEDVADAESTFAQIGYEPRGEYGIPGRRYFVKEIEGRRTHHVHTFEINHSAVIRHLAFRDYLITYPAEAKRYAELKMRLAEQYRNERQRYVEGKSSEITELERKALD